MLKSLQAIVEKNRPKSQKEFFELLSIPSVSSEPKYKKDVEAAASWVKNKIEALGFKTEVWKPTKGHPVIFGNYVAGKDKPTLLIYNHYDVQPCDPLELWDSPPFKPVVKDGKVYARGAQDNKGQLFYVLQALKTLIERDGKLPINIKLCIEGEEEMGSHGLDEILPKKQKQLKADYVAIVDLGIPSPTTPAVTLGTRGLITFDLTLTGPNSDLHSGSHGGLVPNPLHALVELMGSLRDKKGKIKVPGFYNGLEKISAKDKKNLALKFDQKLYEKQFGIVPKGGEKALDPLTRTWMRPTLEINGLWGGYNGDGFKTVIPSKAHAKFSCRLVPGQDPEAVGKKVVQYLKKQAPKEMKLEVHLHDGKGKAVRTPASSTAVKAFAKAYSEVFGTPCKFILEGASIPIVPKLQEACGGEVVMVGLGLATDNIHAPNEHFSLDRIEKGTIIIARALEILS